MIRTSKYLLLLLLILNLFITKAAEQAGEVIPVEIDNISNFNYLLILISTILFLLVLLLLWKNNKNKASLHNLRKEYKTLEKKFTDNEMSNFALQISESNNLLEEIKTSLTHFDTNKNNEDQVGELKLKLKAGLSDKQNKKLLEQRLDMQHSEFIKALQKLHPGLTKSELRLSSLLKLNLTGKEISSINKVSLQAVKVARYRLRKKLALNSDTNISDYLNGI